MVDGDTHGDGTQTADQEGDGKGAVSLTDDATLDTIERLRADVFPEVLDGSPAVAHVGGQTASFADIGDRVNDRLPLFIAAVILLSFLLLMVVFRSVLVPLKAVIMNMLSIGAAYGVCVPPLSV